MSIDLFHRTEQVELKRKKQHSPRRPKKRPRHEPNVIPGGVFQCFTIDGDDVNLYRRSTFSSSRKEEVRGIRRKGACLRCRLLKRACSGEDPCKTCLTAARAASGSRALSWMECIRPSFQSMNIFSTGSHVPDQRRIESILNDLLEDDVSLDFHIPFALNVDAASAHLASWLCDDYAPGTFSVVGVFSCGTNTSLLRNALDPSLGRDLRLFVHLTTHMYTTGMQGGYQHYTDDEIQSVRDVVGDRLLGALDPLLRPTELEASEDKIGKLKSLFLLLLGVTVGMRYTCPDVVDNGNEKPPHPKQEALLQLLCHYLIYIGKVTSLLESTSEEKVLVNKWKQQWNKPAAFTWNSSTGLEMHYRIQPPADWIISSSEDESMSSINLDLTDFEDGAEFTINTDLIKCTGCDTFWASLDTEGLCPTCADSLDEDGNLQSSLDADFSSYFLPDDYIESSATDLFNLPSLPGSPVASGMKTIELCQIHEADEFSDIYQPQSHVPGALEPHASTLTDLGTGLDHHNFQPLQADIRVEGLIPSFSSRIWSAGDNSLQTEVHATPHSTTSLSQHAIEVTTSEPTYEPPFPASKNPVPVHYVQRTSPLHIGGDAGSCYTNQSLTEIAKRPKRYHKSSSVLKGERTLTSCAYCQSAVYFFFQDPNTLAPLCTTCYRHAKSHSGLASPCLSSHHHDLKHSDPMHPLKTIDIVTMPSIPTEKCTVAPDPPTDGKRPLFVCSECSASFRRRDLLHRHRKKKHSPSQSLSTTANNAPPSITASMAINDMPTHEGGTNQPSRWLCPRPTCRKICSSERVLREHLRGCHPNNLSLMRAVDQDGPEHSSPRLEALDDFCPVLPPHLSHQLQDPSLPGLEGSGIQRPRLLM